LATAVPIGLNDSLTDRLDVAGQQDFFTVTLTESGLLTAQAQPDSSVSLASRLSLLGLDGQVLIQSDGASAADPNPLIAEHLEAGTYFLEMAAPSGGTGAYTLTTQFEPATSPFDALPVGYFPYGSDAADFNRDGFLDIVTPNGLTNDVSLSLGLGDGTFRPAISIPAAAGTVPNGVGTGDFNKDGHADLLVGYRSGELSLRLGRGDGTFGQEQKLETNYHSASWGDFNGDGFLDVATLQSGSGDLSIRLGQGDGTFANDVVLPLGLAQGGLQKGDFNGDGRLDLESTSLQAGTVSILLGNGDGTFRKAAVYDVGAGAVSTALADFNGDGHLDVVTGNRLDATLSVLLGRGDGTLEDPVRIQLAVKPNGLAAADFDGDGHVDLAVRDLTHGIKVLLGRGDGTFVERGQFATGLQNVGIITADLNGDGRIDLAVTNQISSTVSVLLGRGDGTFVEQKAQGVPTSGPLALTTYPNGPAPGGIVTADFNGDGRLDVVTANFLGGNDLGNGVSVFLGRGDGTFQYETGYAVGQAPWRVVAGDFNGDGRLDLAVGNQDSKDIEVLLGRGDGTFARPVITFVGTSRFGLAAGDFNGDGRLDLVSTAFPGLDPLPTATLLLGRGDGTFAAGPPIMVGDVPVDSVAGDFNGDGRLDVAFNTPLSNKVALLLGNGDGTFQGPKYFAVGQGVGPGGGHGLGSVVAGDFNRDGQLDLLASNSGSNDVSVLLGNGDGTFGAQRRFAVGESPSRLAMADFNGDGIPDLAVADYLSRALSVLLGNGDGTFGAELRLAAGFGPFLPIVGDFNGDGRIDLASSNISSNDVSVYLGNGDGTFAAQHRLPVDVGAVAVVTTDFNGDGRADLARANPTSNDVAVSLGLGDGTFQEPVRLAVGTSPVALITADFNRDGRPDLAAVDFTSDDVSVLLGLGNGRFQDALRFAVGMNPTFLVAGDFNGDGRLDIATANAGSNDVSLLLGKGDGTFQAERRFAAGSLPQSLAAGDFNGDGRLDLAVTDEASHDITVLFGKGDGTFQTPLRLPLDTAPLALVTADFNGDGHLDLAATNLLTNDVSVLLGKGDGTFRTAVHWAVGATPLGLLVGDFNDDGRPDLAAVDNTSNDLSILLGRGDGTFAAAMRLATKDYPIALAAGDFNGDGRSDLAVATQLSADLSLFEGVGDGTFVPPSTTATEIRSVPLVADLNGDGAADVAVLNRDGLILFRRGRPGATGSFTAPVVVNADPDPAARDLALVRTPTGLVLAALDDRQSALSFYTLHGGTFTLTPGPTVPGALATRLVVGDLNGDGLDDLAVMAAGASEVFVYLQHGTGLFGATPDYSIHVGLNPSDIALYDIDGDHRPDIVVTSQFSGTVSVALNTVRSPFSFVQEFRGGSGLVGMDPVNGRLTFHSREAPLGLVVADFNADGAGDLVVTHSGGNSFSVLSDSGLGGFRNPVSAPTFTTGSKPTVVVTGQFNGDSYADLAILNQDSGDLSIFLGDGHGGFTQRLRLSAGNLPTGLAVNDVNGDGKLDLLVGNEFGDVLTLLGRGDGTFQPYQRLDRHVALAVADLNGDGTDDLVFGNESLDRVTVHYSQPGEKFVQDRGDGVLAPGAVRVADLNQDGIKDLVVANSGSNNVLVYLGLGDGRFGPARSFFTGTNPTNVTVAFLGDDLVADPAGSGRMVDLTPDLVVANEGSNDVTVLLGRGQGAGWNLADGPRLRLLDQSTGRAGIGPVSTTVQDVNGDGLPDILVSARQSDNVFELNGLGRGLFNDQTPVVFNTGPNSGPVQALVGNFDGVPGLDLVTVDAESGNLMLFSGFGSGRGLGSGGAGPVAALAGDFNRDGLADLLVANNESGHVALLLGVENGPAVARLFQDRAVPHPTDLALNDNGSVLYVGEEGEEVVARFTLSLGIAVPTFSDVQTLGGAPSQRLTDLLPLREATLAIVATVLTVVQDEGVALAAEPGSGLPAVATERVAAGATAGVGGAEGQTDDSDSGSALTGWGIDASGEERPLPSLEEELQRNGTELRNHLFDPDPPPVIDAGGNAAIDEVFRKGISAVGAWLDDRVCTLLRLGTSALGVAVQPVPAPSDSAPTELPDASRVSIQADSLLSEPLGTEEAGHPQAPSTDDSANLPPISPEDETIVWRGDCSIVVLAGFGITQCQGARGIPSHEVRSGPATESRRHGLRRVPTRG
jgi:hypothetical protein